MAYTLSPNLRLRLDTNLTSNSKYNLLLLDNLAALGTIDTNGTALFRGRLDLQFTANDASVGGSGTGGNVTFGTAGNPLASFNVFATAVNLGTAALNLTDQADSLHHLDLQYDSTAAAPGPDNANRVLTFDVQGGNRKLVLGGDFLTAGGFIQLTTPSASSVTLPLTGTLATLAGVETLTNKSMSGTANTFSAIPYGALVLTGSIVNSDINAAAAIAYSKLALANSIVNGDINTAAAIAYSKLALTGSIVNSDVSSVAAIAGTKVSPDFGSQNIRTSGALQLLTPGAFVTSVEAAQLGQSAPWTLQLPVSAGVAGQVLTTDGTGKTFWGVGGGGGSNGEFAADWTSGSSITLNHALATKDVEVAIYDKATGADIELSSVTRPDTNHVTLTASSAPPAGGWRVVVLAAGGGGGGGGGVSSVSLVASPEFSVSGSPITGAGTLVFTSVAQSANTFWAGPTTGAAAQPTFRAIVGADLSGVTSDNVTEGATNLYFTPARAQSAISATAPLVDTAGVISIPQATGSVSGYLTALDFTNFNAKQAAGNYITALTGDVTATGPGSAAATVVSVGGSSAALVHSAELLANAATTLNTPSTIVLRDSSGNFAAGTITAQLAGSVSGSSASFTGTLVGNVTGTQGATVVSSVGGSTAANVHAAELLANGATSANTANTIVKRDGSGNFAAGTITANLVGVASGGAVTVTGGPAAASAGAAGGNATIASAAGTSTGSGGNGGQVNVNGGNAGGDNTANQTGGAVSIQAGQSKGTGSGGSVTVASGTGGTGTGTAGGSGGTTNINGGTGGAGSATSGQGGGATLKAGSGGNGVGGGNGGQTQVVGGTGGTGSSTGGTGGTVNVTGGSPGGVAGTGGGAVTIAGAGGTSTGSGGTGGSLTLTSGSANAGDNSVNRVPGNITVTAGVGGGTNTGGQVTISAGTGGIGTAGAGGTGGNEILNAGTGGANATLGGTGGSLQFNAGAGGASAGTPGPGGIIQFFTASTTSLLERLRINSTQLLVTTADVVINTLGNGLQIKSGTNARIGTAILAAGTVTVANTTVTANSRIFLTSNTDGGTPGWLRVSAKVNNTSFTITSSSGTDTSTVAWVIIEGI